MCHADADGAQVCDGFLSNPDASEQVVNLWRVGAVIGGGVDVSVESPDAAVVRDLVAQGSPVLLALALTANGAPAGGHYVVANGIGPDGSVLIRDPNPNFGRANLNDYLAGFVAGGKIWQGTLGAVLRLLPRTPAACRQSWSMPPPFVRPSTPKPKAFVPVLAAAPPRKGSRSIKATRLPK